MADETPEMTAARRKPKPRTSTAIRFPAELHQQLVAAAEARDLSINYLVVKAVADYLPRLIPADQLTLTRSPQ